MMANFTSSLFRLDVLLRLFGYGVVLLFAYCTSYVVYNLYFHPLRKYPGPKLWAACRIPFAISLAAGDLVSDTHEIHKKYGTIVRLAPNEISFIEPEAWKDIYGHRPGHDEFTKNPIWTEKCPNGVFSVINALLPDHRRQRKVLNHAFRPSALDAQEYIVQKNVTDLITKLHELKEVDISFWSSYCTFDIMGDLMFGRPFGCLIQGQYHDWVAYLFSNLKAACLMSAIKFYPSLVRLLLLFLPSKVFEERDNHFHQSSRWLHERMAWKTTRPDFMKYILANNGNNNPNPDHPSDERNPSEEKNSSSSPSMTLAELEASSSILVLAGSVTTAAHIDATLTLLLQHPAKLHKAVREIRTRFARERDISISAAEQTPYLQAVLQESLRLAPPIPGQVPRIVPRGGDTICGTRFPGGTFVSIPQYPCFVSPFNFAHAERFVPERWLDPGHEMFGRDEGDPEFDGGTFGGDRRESLQPFSVGPRACIGRLLAVYESNLVIARLLWNFDMEGVRGCEKAWGEQKSYALWDRTERIVRWKSVGKERERRTDGTKESSEMEVLA